MEKADYELKYDEFWKDIIEKDGVVNLDQVKRELYDFLQMMVNAGKVYCHVTCGQISKPNTNADAVIAIHDEFRSEEIKQAIAEELEEAMEPKTCDGCKFYSENQGVRFCYHDWSCQRGSFDKFKPKD